MNDTVVTNSVKRFKWVGTRPIRPDGAAKVTGRAMYGGDYKLPGMLYGRILRSPHAHARIRSIDTSAAEKLPGVKAVMTAKDMPDQKFDYIGPERVAVNFWHVTRNVMAREKVLYEGHAVAAVAAISASIADEAAALIKVDYEVLPHVIDVDEAMADGAPLLFEDMITRGVEPAPTKPSNISKRLEFQTGDIDAGFASADVVVEKEFKTAAVHQAYIEPHACLARWDADGQTEIWSSSQGHFQMRALTAQILQKPIGDLRVYPAEIGGGFGGKTVTYLEPIATLLSMKSGSPVRLMMNRDDVFRATGPTSGSAMWVKMGVTKDGKLVAADGLFKFQAGAFPGSPVMNGCLCAFAPYDIANARAVGYDVVCNRPKSAAYRAPGSPISAYAVESVIDMLATKIGMDPLELRLKNAARIGTPTIYGPKHAHEGYVQTLEALKNHPAYKTKLGKNQGRGLASGYWFNGGGDSSATIQVNADGTVLVATGSPDIGGSRASMAIMAAETLGVDYNVVRAIVADTGSVGYTHVTGGSRVTFATGTAVVNASKSVVKDLCKRAALIWDVDPEGVIWEDGFAKPAGSNVGDFEPLSLKALAAKSSATGGPITAAASVNAGGQAPGFSSQFCDVEVDPETGKVTILRFVAAQDVGRAIHPSYVEGQIQGGVVQGIGWALNEEYIYNAKGQLDNPGFLDYRCPVASDLPMIEAILVEVPNPAHPYGAKGVGEVNICPPMAAIANAIEHAVGVRMTELPMSPPKVLEAIDEMGIGTTQSIRALPADVIARRSKAAISPRVRTILEDLITSGQIGNGTRQLVALLRGREYSIADLVRDVNAAKAQLVPPHPDFFDELLATCIDETSVVHEAAIENMLSGFCELTAHGEILYANPALRSLLPDCEGRQLTDYFPKHAAALNEALSGSVDKRVYRLELEALDHSRPVLAEFGLVLGGATAYAFISDLTHAQDVQRRAHDTAPFAILKLDPDHHITYANEPASKLLGGTPQTVVGRDAASLVQGPRDVEALEREYEKRRRGETSEYELDVKPINLMPPARVVVRSFPESDPEGRLASTLVTLSPVIPELTAQRILDEISGAKEAGTLFARVLDHLRSLVTFEAAILSVSTPNHEFSRVAFSAPASEVNALWIPIPEAIRGIADEPEPFGSDLRKKLLTTRDGERLLSQDVVQEQLDRGLHGWYALAIKDCDRAAVLTLLHKEDCYGPDTTVALDKAGTRQAMQAVLRLDVAREKDFQFKLLKDIARAETDRDLARLVVTELANFYRWQNVSVFKVNAIQRQFELLEQAKAGNDGFLLPAGYCQPLDTGYLGEAFHQREIQVVPDALASPYKETFVGATTKTRSEMCVPIQLQEQVVWILNLEDTRPNAFEAPEKETVERLLSELVRSLERALGSALLDEVLNGVPDAVVITDLAGKILKCNLSARDMLGGEPKNELLANFFASGSEGAAAVASQTSYPVKGALVGLERTETNVLIRTRIPSVQYDRRVVFMQDSDKLNWQAETRELMQALANVASQVRVPLSLVSSFVRQIGRQAGAQAPRLAEMAKRAVDQLSRVELTYNRVIEQVSRIGHPEFVDVDALLATLLAELPPDRRERVRRPPDPPPRVWADRAQFASAARAMLAYLLRIGDADASIDIRTRVFGDAVGITMFKPTVSATPVTDRAGAAFSPEMFAPNPADEAFARYALDEPGLNQFAISHHGLFRRRRTSHGETLRLVLRTKDATCTTG